MDGVGVDSSIGLRCGKPASGVSANFHSSRSRQKNQVSAPMPAIRKTMLMKVHMKVCGPGVLPTSGSCGQLLV